MTQYVVQPNLRSIRKHLFAVVVAALSILLVSCKGERNSSIMFPLHAVPRIVGDSYVSLPSMHETPSAIDMTSGDFYFTRADSEFSESYLYRVPMGSDEPPSLAPFSSGSYNAGAAFDPNSRTVVFMSKEPTRNPELPDEWNIWRVRTGESEAIPLPVPVNSAASECCATFAPDGSLIFSSNRRESWDIFRAQPDGYGKFSVSRLTGSINSEHDEWPSYISVDGRMILFSSIRPGGPGEGDDIFAACRMDDSTDSWSVQRLSAPINSKAYEDNAMITPDGRAFIWSSWRQRPTGEKLADIYAIAIEAVSLPVCP